jgi:hypothetical protein
VQITFIDYLWSRVKIRWSWLNGPLTHLKLPNLHLTHLKPPDLHLTYLKLQNLHLTSRVSDWSVATGRRKQLSWLWSVYEILLTKRRFC